MNREVKVPCLCEGEQHPDGDTVTFLETIDFRLMVIARKTMAWLKVQQPDADVPEIMAALTDFYLTHCIERWTLRDARNKPLPVSKANVERFLLSRPEVALELAEVADELYQEKVLLPLVNVVSRPSQISSTNGRTSVTSGAGKTTKHSKRSSTTTSRTGATAKTAT